MMLSKRAVLLNRQQVRSFSIFGNMFGGHKKEETAAEINDDKKDQNIEA
jgi:hypothetical protein